jgi:hypothetical protein
MLLLDAMLAFLTPHTWSCAYTVSRLTGTVRVALGVLGTGYTLQMAVGAYIFARPATAAVSAASQGDVAITVLLSMVVWALAHWVVNAFGGSSGTFGLIGMCWMLLLCVVAMSDRPWMLLTQRRLAFGSVIDQGHMKLPAGGGSTSILDASGNFIWARMRVLLWLLPALALGTTLPQARALALLALSQSSSFVHLAGA